MYVNPADFWLIAFLGLAYPILLIVNIVFALFWILRKNKLFLISLIVILLGWNLFSNHFQFFNKNYDSKEINQCKNSPNIEVLSYNVKLFNKNNQAANNNEENKILKFINLENPDIVCLQEFYSSKRGVCSIWNIKKSIPNYKYNFIHYIVKTDSENYGISIFSKYPILNKGFIQFENTANLSIFCDIKLTRVDTIRVFNNHLQSIKLNPDKYDVFTKLNLKDEKQLMEFKDIYSRLKIAYIKRANQVDVISESIKKSPYPVIVCGDFNDTPLSYTYYKMKGSREDAFVESGNGFGNTYIGKLPSFRIDYILYDDVFYSHNFKRIKVYYSDHYPISCVLSLKNNLQ